MRFTIDLLEGTGLPPKSRPAMTALAAVPFLIPVLATAVLAAGWYHKQMLIRTESAVVRQNQEQIERFSEELRSYQETQTGILNARHEMKNIRDALTFEMPVSPWLVELVENLPPRILINRLTLQYIPLRKKQENTQGGQGAYKQVIQRSLRMVLAGPNTLDNEKAVNEYIQVLRKGPALTAVAGEIRIISRQEAELDNQKMILYEIECSFREQTE